MPLYLRMMLVFTAAGLAACGGTGGFGDDLLRDGEPHFGDPYTLVMGPAPTSPDEPPAVDGDSIYVGVTYSGGCRDHEFRLGQRTRRDTLEVWLRHDANGDDCEALLFERIGFPAPDGWREAAALLLIDPSSDHPFVVAR